MAPSVTFMPRSLTHPGGAIFLDPAHRVSREELDRRDARWRAKRERAYARAWSDDATLVGSVQYYAASALRDFEERTLGRNSSRRMLTMTGDETSTLRNHRLNREGSSLRRSVTADSSHHHRTGRLFRLSRRGRRFKRSLRKWVGALA